MGGKEKGDSACKQMLLSGPLLPPIKDCRHIKEIVESTHKQFKMSLGSNDEARHNNFTAHRLTLVTYGFITGFAFLSLQEKMCSTHISHTKKVRLGSC